MALQIFLLLAFQSIYGYVYHQLAILIGLCMAGIALGSWLGIRRNRSATASPCRAMATTQILLAFSAPAADLRGELAGKDLRRAATWLAAQCVFPALAALSGMLGGYQFPIATEIYLHDRSGRRRLGALYAIDLLGGCAGALLLSTYLIPVFGFWRTAWLCAAINLAPALLAARVSAGSQRSRCPISAYGLCSPKYHRRKHEDVGVLILPAIGVHAGLDAGLSRNFCRSHFSSTGTCGSRRPS